MTAPNDPASVPTPAELRHDAGLLREAAARTERDDPSFAAGIIETADLLDAAAARIEDLEIGRNVLREAASDVVAAGDYDRRARYDAELARDQLRDKLAAVEAERAAEREAHGVAIKINNELAAELAALESQHAAALDALGGLPGFDLVEQCKKRQSQLNATRAEVDLSNRALAHQTRAVAETAKERDAALALVAGLERRATLAEALVDAAIDWVRDLGECHFCAYEEDGSESPPHVEGCVLADYLAARDAPKGTR